MILTIVFLLSLLAVVLIQQRSGSRSAELSSDPDEPAHYITGLMMRAYLLHGRLEAPLRFAEKYYLHYPKVALGHWPPLYYVVQSVWMTLFPTTISSLLNLQAVLLAACTTLLFSVVQIRFGVVAAVLLCVEFLILRPTQMLASEIMSEPLLTLATLLAIWAIARYFETGGMRFLVWFVFFVEAAVHTKGSGFVLAGLPVLLAIALGRRDEFRHGSFWMAQLAIVVISAPWQILTWRMGTNGMYGLNSRQFFGQTARFGQITVDVFGWPLLIVIVLGAGIAIASRKRLDALPAACALVACVSFLFHSLIPAGAEDRHLYLAVPAALIVAALAVWQVMGALGRGTWAPAVLVAVIAISIWPINSFHKVAVGYRAVSQWLLSNSGPGQEATLVASDDYGEGMLISEVGQNQPEPSKYILRATKMFEDCDWTGVDCRSTVTDPLQAQQILDSIPVRYVVIDHFSDIPSRPYMELLRHTIAARPDLWILRDTQPANAPVDGKPGEIRVYQRLGFESKDIHVTVNLTRMLGRVIGD